MLKIFNETLIPANVTIRGVTDGKHYTLAFHRVMAGPNADEEDKFTPVLKDTWEGELLDIIRFGGTSSFYVVVKNAAGSIHTTRYDLTLNNPAAPTEFTTSISEFQILNKALEMNDFKVKHLEYRMGNFQVENNKLSLIIHLADEEGMAYICEVGTGQTPPVYSLKSGGHCSKHCGLRTSTSYKDRDSVAQVLDGKVAFAELVVVDVDKNDLVQGDELPENTVDAIGVITVNHNGDIKKCAYGVGEYIPYLGPVFSSDGAKVVWISKDNTGGFRVHVTEHSHGAINSRSTQIDPAIVDVMLLSNASSDFFHFIAKDSEGKTGHFFLTGPGLKGVRAEESMPANFSPTKATYILFKHEDHINLHFTLSGIYGSAADGADDLAQCSVAEIPGLNFLFSDETMMPDSE